MATTEPRTGYASEDAPVGSAITTVAGERPQPTLVPSARYTSPEFAALEMARMWPRVWHVACTPDHVAEPGDFFEHRLGQYSVLVVPSFM